MNEEVAGREIGEALDLIKNLGSELLGLQSAVYLVKVSSVVLEDVHQLCHALWALTEATSSTRAILLGRARASARREERHRSREV